jgi:hypothetical protein
MSSPTPELVSQFHSKIVELQDQIQGIVSEFKSATKEVTIEDVVKEIRFLERNLTRNSNDASTWMVNQMDDQAFVIVFCIICFVAIAIYFCCLFITQTLRRNRCACAMGGLHAC